ncbi:MAG: SoxR reducing system RseC family protein [Candidatus Sulfobium sp.]
MIGIVKSIDGSTARVFVEEGPGCCDQCRKDTCDISARGVETEAFNLARAKVGQKVNVDMKTVTYLKGTLIFYVLPVLALFIGAILGWDYLPSYFGATDPNLLGAAGGFFLFLLSLIFVKLLAGRMEKKTEHRSVIESVIED